MSWNKKDIIAEIEKNNEMWKEAGQKPIDVNLPYWELRNAYTQRIYHNSLMGHGSRAMALERANTPPPDSDS